MLGRVREVRDLVERAPDGKTRVPSGSWNGEKVIRKDQVLEIRNVDQRVHVARKPRHRDQWAPRSSRDPAIDRRRLRGVIDYMRKA
jgi:hypothetical protein